MWNQVIKVHFQDRFEDIKAVIRSTGNTMANRKRRTTQNKNNTQN
jgi:hypothetical protein